jgi:hypothetical protein
MPPVVKFSVGGVVYDSFDDVPEDARERITNNVNRVFNKAFNEYIERAPEEIQDSLWLALTRIIHENNLRGIFCHLDAMKILIKMHDENHPDLEKYLTEPIPELKITTGKNGAKSYSYSFNDNKM